MIKEKPNSRARNRDYMWRKARRKQRLDICFCSPWYPHPYYNNLHQYSKNKIHCSCPDCSPKTRNKGYRRRHKHGNYNRSLNYKISDLRKLLDMNYQEEEFYIDFS